MRNVVLGALLGAGLVSATAAIGGGPGGSRSDPALYDGGSSRDLIAITSNVDERHEQLLVVDPRLRAVGVYHVDRQSGGIALKSVRNIHWDLQMIEFNVGPPTTREVRSMVEQN